MESGEIKQMIRENLKQQGYSIRDNRILPPSDLDKSKLREMHGSAVHQRILKSRSGLIRFEADLLKRIANGMEVMPEKVDPRLVEVLPDTTDELLFRYATLHWSIPVSSGYGRRLRFLVIDGQNEKLIGLIGLGDPVFSLAGRDAWIGWDKKTRRERLHYVMDAFALGAVPPYSFLLSGKLIAMLAASNEVREAYQRKYQGRKSVISGKNLDTQLALITTTSALGRSSVYNRLKYRQRPLYHSVGFTRGSGDFHFSNGIYNIIAQYAAEHCTPTAKPQRWGTGFRNRREVIKKCLAQVGLSTEWLYHGVRREVFVVPLAGNAGQFLRDQDLDLVPFDQSAAELFSWFRTRWLLPRAKRDSSYQEFTSESYRLWDIDK